MEMAFMRNKALINRSAVFLLSTFLLAFIAQESLTIEDVHPPQVKYIGGDNEALIFNVKFDNKNGGAIKMPAFDESTVEPLLQDSYSVRDFEKKFKIPGLTDSDYMTFLIRSAKANTQFTHKVKVTTRVVDETVS